MLRGIPEGPLARGPMSISPSGSRIRCVARPSARGMSTVVISSDPERPRAYELHQDPAFSTTKPVFVALLPPMPLAAETFRSRRRIFAAKTPSSPIPSNAARSTSSPSFLTTAKVESAGLGAAGWSLTAVILLPRRLGNAASPCFAGTGSCRGATPRRTTSRAPLTAKGVTRPALRRDAQARIVACPTWLMSCGLPRRSRSGSSGASR